MTQARALRVLQGTGGGSSSRAVSCRMGLVNLTIGSKAATAEADVSGRTVSSTACMACIARMTCIACMAAESTAPKCIALIAAGLPACTAAGRAAAHAAV